MVRGRGAERAARRGLHQKARSVEVKVEGGAACRGRDDADAAEDERSEHVAGTGRVRQRHRTLSSPKLLSPFVRMSCVSFSARECTWNTDTGGHAAISAQPGTEEATRGRGASFCARALMTRCTIGISLPLTLNTTTSPTDTGALPMYRKRISPAHTRVRRRAACQGASGGGCVGGLLYGGEQRRSGGGTALVLASIEGGLHAPAENNDDLAESRNVRVSSGRRTPPHRARGRRTEAQWRPGSPRVGPRRTGDSLPVVSISVFQIMRADETISPEQIARSLSKWNEGAHISQNDSLKAYSSSASIHSIPQSAVESCIASAPHPG